MPSLHDAVAPAGDFSSGFAGLAEAVGLGDAGAGEAGDGVVGVIDVVVAGAAGWLEAGALAADCAFSIPP